VKRRAPSLEDLLDICANAVTRLGPVDVWGA
jgi:hypothetical protein